MQAKVGVIGYYASKLKLVAGKGKKATYPSAEVFGVLGQLVFLSFHPFLIVWVHEIRLVIVDKKV